MVDWSSHFLGASVPRRARRVAATSAIFVFSCLVPLAPAQAAHLTEATLADAVEGSSDDARVRPDGGALSLRARDQLQPDGRRLSEPFANETPAQAQPAQAQQTQPQPAQPAQPAQPQPVQPQPVQPQPVQPQPVQPQPAPVLTQPQPQPAPQPEMVDPAILARQRELAELDRATARALVITGIIFGVGGAAWGGAFAAASHSDPSQPADDPGFVASSWIGGLALSSTAAGLIPYGLVRGAESDLVLGLGAKEVGSEAAMLASGIVVTSMSGLLLITSPLLYTESSQLNARMRHSLLATFIPASITLAGAGIGLIQGANVRRRERRRRAYFSAAPYFGGGQTGVALSGRF